MLHLQSVAFLSLGLLILPFLMRVFLTHWKLRWGFPLSARRRYKEESLRLMRKSAFFGYVFFEFGLALCIGGSLGLIPLAILSIWEGLGPYIFKVSVTDVVMMEPLRVGVFLFILSSVLVPWFLFHYVGVACMRDTHQICKEMRDCLLSVAERLRDLEDTNDSQNHSTGPKRSRS